MTDKELEIYYLLSAASMLSECRDKRVAAVSTFNERIIGLSWNKPYCCNHKCDHTCKPVHAEKALNIKPGCTVWLNLFPCEDCQKYLYNNGVAKVVVFNIQHKPVVTGQDSMEIVCRPNVAKALLDYNGMSKQLLVAAGECGELITAVADAARTDREVEYRAIEEEIVDVLLQMFIISDSTFAQEWQRKLRKLAVKFCREEPDEKH